MKKYSILYQDGEVIQTEEEILDEYYPYWSARMLEHGGLSPSITLDRCLDDFIVTRWAVEV